jgi:hypothetical protein
MMRKIFGPKREGLIRETRKLHSEELYSLYFPSVTIRTSRTDWMGRVGHYARIGQIINGCKNVVWKIEGLN